MGDLVENDNISKAHKLMMLNRKSMEITGVEDVISFDTKEVLLETTMGILTIKGYFTVLRNNICNCIRCYKDNKKSY